MWFLPEVARWPYCAASPCTVEQPGWGLAVGDPGSETEDWTTVSCTGQPVRQQTAEHWKLWSENKRKLLDNTSLLCLLQYSLLLQPYLVGVHRQQSFVKVDGLKLLLRQLVFNTFSVCQLHLFLWVEHILVLREQTELSWNHLCLQLD